MSVDVLEQRSLQGWAGHVEVEGRRQSMGEALGKRNGVPLTKACQFICFCSSSQPEHLCHLNSTGL